MQSLQPGIRAIHVDGSQPANQAGVALLVAAKASDPKVDLHFWDDSDALSDRGVR
jgi:hypothetical protein